MRLGGVLEGRGERGLGGEVGRSVDVAEGEGHACKWDPANAANAGGAQLRIRAELGPRPTSIGFRPGDSAARFVPKGG